MATLLKAIPVPSARAPSARELLLEEARRLRLEPATRADAAGRTATDDALIKALLEREIAPRSMNDWECWRYYEARHDHFRTEDGKILPFETVRGTIQETLDARASSAAAARYVMRLAAGERRV